MNLSKTHVVSLCLGLVLAACGDDQVSSPVPQPVPDFVRQSTPGLTQSKKLVLGLPGAVAGKGKVHLTDKATGTKVVGDSAAAGSFALVIATAHWEATSRAIAVVSSSKRAGFGL